MSDIINLLPDSLANQIAAGEVIQRPASAVKELLENSIDAQSTHIHLIIKDAGKTLIQVVDNGVGMSETDARMCFERHATSKIKVTEDLFNITTKGFRGEAMASVAAIAQVELKTCQEGQELGTMVRIEASKITKQEDIATPQGTSIAIKNLFFNVPARRKYLKKDSIENKHIVEEFQRVTLAHPEIHFVLTLDEKEIFNLYKGRLSQRIVSVFGKNYQEKIVRSTEDTEIIKISGYIGKPETAKKSRGEQYLFVNNRFIRSTYFHHAISDAYDGLIDDKTHPFYVLFIEIDPNRIDVNVHPTKTEVKFEDESTLYAIFRACVKRSLGVNNIAPTIDFNENLNFSFSDDNPPKRDYDDTNSPFKDLVASNEEPIDEPASFNENDSPFSGFSTPNNEKEIENGAFAEGIDWDGFYKGLEGSPEMEEKPKPPTPSFENIENDKLVDDSFSLDPFADMVNTEPEPVQGSLNLPSSINDENYFSDTVERHELSKQSNNKNVTFQIAQSYITAQVKTGLILIDQQAAHERILYERFSVYSENPISTQKFLFPQTTELSITDYALATELQEELRALGFQFSLGDNNSITLEGIPSDLPHEAEHNLLETFIDQFKNNKSELKLNNQENLARSLANRSSIKKGKVLTELEMSELINQLFACENPNYSPNGTPTYVKIDKEFIADLFINKSEIS
ncbi:MAG: DNA mismatch repair endonuclease MutL [Cytophagales bacterium]|nr:DNA mismatch repair endonuclease MutL [Cytophagales bacterium]